MHYRITAEQVAHYQGEKSACLCPLHSGIRIAKENNAAKPWVEQDFPHIEKRQQVQLQ